MEQDYIKNQFVTYEIALKLKELGFDEPCLAYYSNKYGDIELFSEFTLDHSKTVFYNYSEYETIAPLFQQIIDWFREKYKLYVNIEPKITKEWEFSISELNKGLLFGNKSLYINKNLDFYKAREQAIFKAIKLCQNKE